MLQTFFQNVPTSCQNEILHLHALKIATWECKSTTKIKKSCVLIFRFTKWIMTVGDISIDADWLQSDSKEGFTGIHIINKIISIIYFIIWTMHALTVVLACKPCFNSLAVPFELKPAVIEDLIWRQRLYPLWMSSFLNSCLYLIFQDDCSYLFLDATPIWLQFELTAKLKRHGQKSNNKTCHLFLYIWPCFHTLCPQNLSMTFDWI